MRLQTLSETGSERHWKITRRERLLPKIDRIVPRRRHPIDVVSP